ncbi:MAG TPA: hypothetical protein VGT02_07905, partial [Methylomirabilota bacterium]|nr:hypothetical protein [Methylomirabilota bacterium]
MSRYRPSRLGLWLRALGVVVAYLAATAALFWLDVGDAGLAPPWAVVAVPPFVYAVLSLVLLRRTSFGRRLSWLGGACLTYVALGVSAAAVFSNLTTLAPISALAHAFARLGPAPFLTLVAAPLVLRPFRGRVLSPRPARPASREPLHFTPVTGETPFAREARRRTGAPEPAAAPSAPAAAAPAAPVAAPAAPAPPLDEAVIRIRFERVAAQLPAGVFTLPMDRVAESLREPHWLTVPRRVVVAQLAEGAVHVDWALVASQFPSLALAITDVEFRSKYPDLKLILPMDDVLKQLPRGVLATGGSPSPLAGLDAFPAPFQPLAVPRDVVPSAPAASDSPDLPPGVVIASPGVAVAPPPPVAIAPPPAPVVAAPAAVAPVVPPPPLMAPPPLAPPPPIVAPPALVATPPPVVTSPPVVAPPPPPPPAPAPVVAVAPPREVIDREALARLAAGLTGAGTFESWSGVVDGVPLVAFLAPTLPRDAVTAVAARIAALLGAAAGEQVTVRTARAAIVVSAAPTPVVVAARRPGAPVALLELRGARAASLVGRAGEGAGPPARALATLALEPRVVDVAGRLGAFGEMEPALLADPAGARVYVFREPGREAKHVAALALAAWEVARTRDGDLGALES